jgi:Protein of unknown function (DUF3025)
MLPDHPALKPLTPWKCPLNGCFQGIWPETAIWSGFSANHRVVNARGLPIRFVAPTQPTPAALAFEQRIYEHGEVETRHTTWHDTFHACTWLLFPRTKARINALHMEEGSAATPNARSVLRNRLTLFDEGGLVVVSTQPLLLECLRQRAWHRLFWQQRQAVQTGMDFTVFGHALYERILNLHYGSTGRGWLLHAPPDYFEWNGPARVAWVDATLAQALVTSETAKASLAQLMAIPVKGIPGWATENVAENYYHDTQQFRPGRSRSNHS